MLRGCQVGHIFLNDLYIIEGVAAHSHTMTFDCFQSPQMLFFFSVFILFNFLVNSLLHSLFILFNFLVGFDFNFAFVG